jgi:hypothetical protein
LTAPARAGPDAGPMLATITRKPSPCASRPPHRAGADYHHNTPPGAGKRHGNGKAQQGRGEMPAKASRKGRRDSNPSKVADSCRHKTCQNAVFICYNSKSLKSDKTIENIDLYGYLMVFCRFDKVRVRFPYALPTAGHGEWGTASALLAFCRSASPKLYLASP